MNKTLVSLSLISILLTSMLASSCSDTTLGTKSFTETLDQLTIPGAPVNFGNLDLPELNFPLDLKDQEGYSSLDIVTSVNVRSASFTISEESDNPELDRFSDNNPDNFDFLNSLTLSLVATIDGRKQTVQVATLPEGDPQVGSNLTKLELVIDDVDVRDYVEAPDVELAILASGTVPPDFVIIDPVIRFRVGVGVR